MGLEGSDPLLTVQEPGPDDQEGVELRDGPILVREATTTSRIQKRIGYQGPYIDPGVVLVDSRARPLKASGAGTGDGRQWPQCGPSKASPTVSRTHDLVRVAASR